MRAVLISIQPKWCESIANGKKTVEVRKTKPKLDTPFKCYIYCTVDKRLLRKFDKGERIDDEHFFDEHVFVRQNTWIRGHFNPNKKVIGEFVCNRIDDMRNVEQKPTCLTVDEWLKYTDGHKGIVYGWHISDLVIYDKPKELNEFFHACDKPKETDCSACSDRRENKCKAIKRPPQSWCYVEKRD